MPISNAENSILSIGPTTNVFSLRIYHPKQSSIENVLCQTNLLNQLRKNHSAVAYYIYNRAYPITKYTMCHNSPGNYHTSAMQWKNICPYMEKSRLLLLDMQNYKRQQQDMQDRSKVLILCQYIHLLFLSTHMLLWQHQIVMYLLQCLKTKIEKYYILILIFKHF